MIRTNSTQKNNKFHVAQPSLSPFNSAIRLSNHNIDTPSTPQRQLVSNNALRLVNQQEVRQSTNNTSFTPNGKFKENKQIFPAQIQQLINDNNYLVQALEKARQDLQHSQENQQLEIIRSRMENLERVIDAQAQEIEEWKKKYNQVCVNDPCESMQQMESQILLVIKENERLNVLIKNIQESQEQKDTQFQLLSNKNQQQETEIKKLKDKIRFQDRTIQNQKDGNLNYINQLIEIKQWQETFNEFEKNSKVQVSHESDLLKSKMKIQELEFQLHKRKISETGSAKCTQRDDQDTKIRQLLEENSKLQSLLQQVQEENQEIINGRAQQCELLKQELMRQQLYTSEELNKMRGVFQQNNKLQQALEEAREHIKVIESQLKETEVSDQLFEDFINSQQNCINIVQQLM